MKTQPQHSGQHSRQAGMGSLAPPASLRISSIFINKGSSAAVLISFDLILISLLPQDLHTMVLAL